LSSTDYALLLSSSTCKEEFIASVEHSVIEEYRHSFPENREILGFTQLHEHCTFDLSSKEVFDHEARIVFVWAMTSAPDGKRDSNYQRGYPIKDVCAGRPLDRGHFIPFSGGGQFGPNMFQQDRALNRGWSQEGRIFRSIERAASSLPGSIYFVRPCYIDNSAFPALIETGALVNGILTTGVFRNRFDALAMPAEISSEQLLDNLLPAMSSIDFGMLGEETAAVWLEKDTDAILVSLEDTRYSTEDGLKDLDIVAILSEELVCYEVKTRLVSKVAGRLTQAGNLVKPRLGYSGRKVISRQASQLYVKQRLGDILNTASEYYEGVESRVITVDLKAMLIQEFFCSDDGRIKKPVGCPFPCRDHAIEALDRLRDYLLSR